MRLAGFVLMLLPTVVAAAPSDQDFDLACAVTAAAEIGASASGSAEQNIALQVHAFYLGRMTGRADGIYWRGVVLGRLSELGSKGKSSERYGQCVDFFTKNL